MLKPNIITTGRYFSANGSIDGEAISHALESCMRTGVGIAAEAVKPEITNAIGNYVGRLIMFKEKKDRGVGLRSRPLILEPRGLLERMVTGRRGGALHTFAEQISGEVKHFAKESDIPELTAWHSNRAVINRFKATKDNPAILFGHRDPESVGDIVPILSLHEGEFWYDDPSNARTLPAGSLTFLTGRSLSNRRTDIPVQPAHGAQATSFRESVAFIDFQPQLSMGQIVRRLA